MTKKIKAVHTVKLLVEAQSDKPTPTIAATLSPKKVKAIDFLKAVKAKTTNLEKGTPVPVIVFIDAKGAFEVEVKTPPAAYLLKKAAKIDKGVEQARKMPDVGSITKEQLMEIAKVKLPDLSCGDLEQAMKTVQGTAASMGITIKTG